MSIKGYPSQEKVTSALIEYPDIQEIRADFATLQLNSSKKVGLNTINQGYFRVGPVKTIVAPAVDSKRVLYVISHGAQIGDMVRFEGTAANPHFEAQITAVPDGNYLVLGSILPADPVAGDELYVLRAVTPLLDEDGNPQVALTPTAVKYIEDGVLTDVEKDTVTPANTKRLPVEAQNLSNLTDSVEVFSTLGLPVHQDKLDKLNDSVSAEVSNPELKTAAKGATLAGFPTSESISSDIQALHVKQQGPVTSETLVAKLLFYKNYAMTPVTTATYVPLLTVGMDIKEIEIFDSSGEVIALAFGTPEVDQFYIVPGGNGRMKVSIPAGTILSIKAKSANATDGLLVINFFGV